MRLFDRILACLTSCELLNRHSGRQDIDNPPAARIPAPLEIWAFQGDFDPTQSSSIGKVVGSRPHCEDDHGVLKFCDGPEPVCQIMSHLHLEWGGYEQFEITKFTACRRISLILRP